MRQVSYRCEGSSLLNKLLPPPSPGPPDYDYHKAKTNLRDYMQLVLPKNWASEYLTSHFKFWWKCHFFEKPKFSKLAYLGIHEKFCHEEFPAFDHFPTSSSYVKFAWKINSNICFHIIYTSLKRKKKFTNKFSLQLRTEKRAEISTSSPFHHAYVVFHEAKKCEIHY